LEKTVADKSNTAVFSARLIWIAAAATILIVGAAGLGLHLRSAGGIAPVASFVGSETCAGCHRVETKLWDASQHKAAMQHATDKTVLGDFNDRSFDYYSVHSRFFRKGGKFMVETDGPDGKLAEFEVKYTFGIDPLQQYLIEFPDGRVQALSIAWDTRPKEKGGQRWFHIYPNEEIRHDDILHWTKLNQNWNFMCAECHSTGLRKNYDAKTDHFATSWAEMSVGCEACHGQGSAHAAWAHDQRSWWPFGKREDANKGLLVRFDERRGVTWPIDPKSATARRSAAPVTLRKEVETCGFCHARRASFHEDWVPGQWLSQTHVVEPLTRNTIMPTVRSATWRSRIIMRRSSRAGCSPPASPAAIATSHTVQNFGSRAKVSACNAMRPTSSPMSAIAITPRPTRRPLACRATCRRAPTWSSTLATITVFVFRGPIFPTG
jgi:hypothetical protein